MVTGHIYHSPGSAPDPVGSLTEPALSADLESAPTSAPQSFGPYPSPLTAAELPPELRNLFTAIALLVGKVSDLVDVVQRLAALELEDRPGA